MIGRAELARDLLIVVCAISAGIHAGLTPDHLAEGAGAGGGFVGSTILLAALAVALSRRVTVPALAGAVGVFSGLLTAYVLAITTGVPLLHPESEPIEGLALFTKAVELVGLFTAVHLLAQARTAARPIPLGLTGLIACFSALVALAVSSGHSHAHGERKTSGRYDTNQACRHKEERSTRLTPSSTGGETSSPLPASLGRSPRRSHAALTTTCTR
jgi:hypothetical protein